MNESIIESIINLQSSISDHIEWVDVHNNPPLEIGSRRERRSQGLAHVAAIRALDEELRAELTAQFSERRGRRAEHPKIAGALALPHFLGNVRGIVHRAGERSCADDRVDQRDERRIAHRPPEMKLALEERRVVL